MITAIKARAPVTGGNFGVWGGMFSTFDCAVKGIRKKEDPYNSIIAGFFTGGALAVRGGYKAARNGAIMCAIFLAVIEGVGIGIQRLMAENTRLDVSGSRDLTKQMSNIYSSLLHLAQRNQDVSLSDPARGYISSFYLGLCLFGCTNITMAVSRFSTLLGLFIAGFVERLYA
jgi:hypothetical protein